MTPTEALAGFPGWEEAEIAPLPGGTTDRTWLVTSGQRTAVLKVDPEPRSRPLNRRDEEARIQTIAAAAGLAPDILHASATALLSRFVPGEVWTRERMSRTRDLEDLAAALRRLHALPPPDRRFEALAAARDYAARSSSVDPGRTRHCIEILEKMPAPDEPRLCHNDLVAANILSAPAVTFLDWEYASANDPCFDLATVIAHHGLTDEHSGILLQAYSGSADTAQKEKLDAYCEYYEALLWLWQAALDRG